MKVFFYAGVLTVLLAGCVPKEQVVLRSIQINEIGPKPDGSALLKADAVFYNPNTTRMRLKEIDIEIFVDGKKAAEVDQELSSLIKAKSEFTIPLEVQLNLKEIGLLDTILSFLGGKKHEIQFVGTLKMKVNGFPVKAPVNQKEEFKF
ncbi:MAG TPA: hypothetical protein PLR06_08905 [Cyclobacteriaceae bacterium]|nr:hypothetical protein [Cyclobacteriaceae bacterium]